MPAEALEDLEIERTDGVDEPATGRKFLIAKSEDAAELGANLEAIAKASQKALTKLAKAKGGFDKETVQALTKLAKLCDVDVEFTVRKEADPPEGEPKPDEPKPDGAGGDVAQAVKSAITSVFEPLKKSIDALTEKLEKCEKMDDEEDDDDEEDGKNPFKAPKKKAESSQAEDDRPVVKSTRRKMGEGLFANIIHQ